MSSAINNASFQQSMMWAGGGGGAGGRFSVRVPTSI